MGKHLKEKLGYIILFTLLQYANHAFGCTLDPPYRPLIPLFSEREWNKLSKAEGDKAYYYCPAKYRSVIPGNATSTCQNDGTWSSLTPSTFKCERVQCSEQIPQVSMYGYTDWNEVDRYAGQRIRYYCLKYYYATVYGNIEITCGNDGRWTPLPMDYDCVTFSHAEKLGLDPQIKDQYDYYREGPKKDEDFSSSRNWFLIITIPCIAGLGLILFICLCCTRTDSPLYWFCRGNTRNDKYLWG